MDRYHNRTGRQAGRDGNEMTITQTGYFRAEVDRLVSEGDRTRYLVGGEKARADLLQRMTGFRGAEFTRKAAAKANQRLKAKLYVSA